jgi:hypothetical protein
MSEMLKKLCSTNTSMITKYANSMEVEYGTLMVGYPLITRPHCSLSGWSGKY